MRKLSKVKFSAAVYFSFLFIFSIYAYANSPDDLFEKIKTYDFDQDQKILIAVEQLVFESLENPAKRKDLARRLAALLDSDATYACKQFACRQLAIIGSADEVPVLCRWLPDDQMSDMVRYALARITDPSVDACLRKALKETKGSRQIGIINTIGMRADKKAVEPLEKLLYSENSEVSKSAAWALGRISGKTAAESLKKAFSDPALSEFYVELADAYLECAGAFLQEGDKNQAMTIYEEMFSRKNKPQIRAAALNGLQASGYKNAFTYVLEALADDQVEVQRMAGRLVERFPGQDQTEAFAKQLVTLSAEGQVLLLNGLKERGDSSAASAVEATCQSGNISVRVAALEALGKLGNASHVSFLTSRAAHSNDAEQKTARNSLIMLRGEKIDDELVRILEQSDSDNKVECINALAARQSLKAVPLLLKASQDSDKNVQKSAFKALGQLATDREIPDMLDLPVSTDKEVEKSAGDALVAISRRTKTGKNCTSIILSKIASEQNKSLKISLLHVLGKIGDDSALPYLQNTLANEDEQLQAAAIRGLGEWPNTKPIDNLVFVAKQSENPTQRILALRGYIRLIGISEDLAVSDKLKMYQDAMSLAEETQEKVKILSELSAISSIETMRLIEPYLKDRTIQAEAATAIINIARQIYAQDIKYTKSLMNWIASNIDDQNVLHQTREVNRLIDELSVYVLDWQVSGPYSQPGKTGPELFDIDLNPEIDNGNGVIWRPAKVGTNSEKPFLIDLKTILNANEDQVAYLRTTLFSAKSQKVLFGIGSDDGIKVWLNGKVIHANNLTRGYWQNEDWVHASLESGKNELLLKVTQHTGGWGTSVSMQKPDTTRAEGIRIDAWPVQTTFPDQDTVPIFDGQSLTGWEGNTSTFRILNGAIVAGTMKNELAHNEFLCTKKEYGNFILHLKVKLIGNEADANAGIQVRSRRLAGTTEMIGYQADMGQQYWGSLYDESRLKKVIAQADPADLRRIVKTGEWNDYLIRCEGKRIRLYINGYRTIDFTETDESIEQTGVIGLQIHAGPASEAWYKEISIQELPPDIPFRVRVINAESRFEAAGILDVNNDKQLDIFCGSFWYEAPNWEKHFVREQTEVDEYYNDFANLPLDINEDGWTDIVNAAFFNKTLFWIRNPGKSGESFKVIDIDRPGSMETAVERDINNDGRPDILPNDGGSPAWYEFHPDKSEVDGVRWEKHHLPGEVSGHGNGAGDVDGDGECDIVCRKGWLQQTKDSASAWIWHQEFDLGDRPGIPILVHDTDADGDADLIWGHAHDYGLYWLEQHQDTLNHRIWEKHIIDSEWSQVHFMLLADLNNDGQKELVTGKRYRAHNGHDPGGNDPLCVYYYHFDRSAHQWYRHTISQGDKVGFGINTQAADIDGDGDIDIVAPGKSGLYLLENLLN